MRKVIIVFLLSFLLIPQMSIADCEDGSYIVACEDWVPLNKFD